MCHALGRPRVLSNTNTFGSTRVSHLQANIQRLADGLFLECARQVASKYPDIEFRELIIDNACMQVCWSGGMTVKKTCFVFTAGAKPQPSGRSDVHAQPVW